MAFTPLGSLELSKRWLRWAHLAAASSLFFATPGVLAQVPSPAALTWIRLSGAEACPGPAELARRVDALLRRSAFVGPASATRFFQVSVQPNVAGVGWETHIVVNDEGNETLGTRDLSVPQAACSDAVDATALALALMVDPNSNAASAAFPLPAPDETKSPISPPATTEPVVRNVTSEPAPPSRTTQTAPQQRSGWRTRLGLGVLGVVGALPDPSLGALVGVRSSPAHGSLGLDLSAGYLGLQRTDLSARSGAEFGAVLIGIGVWVTPWSLGNLHVSLAAGGQASRITGCGFGFTLTSGCQSSLLVGAAADAELAWALNEHWGLAVRPGVGVPFVRDTFQVTTAEASQQPVFRPSSVIGWLSLGVVVAP